MTIFRMKSTSVESQRQSSLDSGHLKHGAATYARIRPIHSGTSAVGVRKSCAASAFMATSRQDLFYVRAATTSRAIGMTRLIQTILL